MKRKTNDLYKLVQSLTGAEKRYFSLYAKASSKEEDPLYMRMFRELAKAESKPEEDLKGYSPTVVTTTKQRLFENILRSLRSLYADKSVDIIIQNYLSEVEVLYRHSLPDQGLLLLRKAHQLAESNEKFGLLLQVLEWEKRLNIVIDHPSRTAESIVAEERETLKKLEQIMALELIYSRALKLKKQYGYARGDARIQLEHETVSAQEMPELKDCLSNKAVFYHNFIYALYHWMTFDHQRSFHYSKSLLNPGKNTILPNDFINALLQHITSSVCLGYFEDALHGIDLGEAYVKEYQLDQSRTYQNLMFAYHATYEMIVYNYTGQYRELRRTIGRTEEKLVQFDQVLSFEVRHIILGNLMNAYMGIGELEKADGIWDSMFNRQSSAVRRDIYADLYLFRLFRLLQSGTYVLLPSAALSAYRYYKKFDDAKDVFEVEMPIALLLQKEHRFDQPQVLAKIVGQLRTIVKDYIKSLKGARQFQEHYTRYVIWCDAIINNEPYHQAAKRWYEKYRKVKRLKPLAAA